MPAEGVLDVPGVVAVEQEQEQEGALRTRGRIRVWRTWTRRWRYVPARRVCQPESLTLSRFAGLHRQQRPCGRVDCFIQCSVYVLHGSYADFV